MRQFLVTTLLVFGVFLTPGQAQQRTYLTADSLATVCQNVYLSSGLYDKHGKPKRNADLQKSYQLGQCNGYITGLLDGIDGTSFTASDGTLKVVHIAYIASNQDLISSFMRYVAANPLAKNKTAQEVIDTVLIENNLMGVTVAQRPLQVKEAKEQ
jgi:hypothetical protein